MNKVNVKSAAANITARACKHCNAMRQDRVLSGYGATLHAVIGPPRADFGMAMQSMLRRDSIVVSFDSLLRDLCPTQSKATDGLRLAAAMAWDGAARTLAKSSEPLDVWLVRTLPRHTAKPAPIGRMAGVGLRCARHRDTGRFHVRSRTHAAGVSDGAAVVRAASHTAGRGRPARRQTTTPRRSRTSPRRSGRSAEMVTRFFKQPTPKRPRAKSFLPPEPRKKA